MNMDSLCFFDNGNKYPYLVRRTRRSYESLPEGVKENLLSSTSANKLDTFLNPKKRVPLHSEFDSTTLRERKREKKQLTTIKEDNTITAGKLGNNKKLQKLIEQAGLDDRVPENEIEDDTRFLFEEAKFSATSVILQLGKLLDVVVNLRKENPQKAPALESKDSRIVLRQGSTDIVWRFDSPSLSPSLSRYYSGTGFHPSDAIVDLLSISYAELIKNTQYRQREWQTHTYKHVVDSTVKGTDSGIFSVPQTAMSGIYVKGDDNNLKTNKKTRKSEGGSFLNANANARKDSTDLPMSKVSKMRRNTKHRTRIERYSVTGKDGKDHF